MQALRAQIDTQARERRALESELDDARAGTLPGASNNAQNEGASKLSDGEQRLVQARERGREAELE